jgi:malonyl-CoA decarboxylase
MGSFSSFRDMIDAIAERGRRLLVASPGPRHRLEAEDLVLQCEHLLSSRGEASGLALAQDILSAWKELDDAGQRAFMRDRERHRNLSQRQEPGESRRPA